MFRCSLRRSFLAIAIAVVVAALTSGMIPAPGINVAPGLPAAVGAPPAAIIRTVAATSSAKTAASKLALGMSASQKKTATAKKNLAAAKVAKDASMAGYARTKFPHWRDASTWGWPTKPNNACNARNAALYRDGKGVKMSKSCTNLTGSWLDPYTGRTYSKASDVDIDHVVPLAEAWRSGAAKWSTTKRTQFANDPLVLVTVEDNANQSKGDKDPARWKPANKASHCLYAKRWVAVKTKYKLTYDKAEKSALSAMLKTC